MPLLYDIALGLYQLGIRAAAPFKPKAAQWVEGRKGTWKRLEAKRAELKGCLWMHCASVGEFEQGRPVLEALKRQRPGLPVLLTFFSPSGYEARKDFPLAAHVEYLPMDSAANAERFRQLVQPRMAVFVKYEFWYHHLHALRKADVPAYLVSAIFRDDQPFFKWYGSTWRKMLGCYRHIFTQNEDSRKLLESIGTKQVTVSGDTRFDRVLEIARTSEELPVAQAFRGDGPALICGSTWPADDDLILDALRGARFGAKVIVAPHELTAHGLQAVEASYPKPLVRWSELERTPPANIATMLGNATNGVLLVDRMGLLARLYRYGDVAYVGGGFGDGIHSLLEAAAWGRPVIFGPRHTKFAEAQGLIDAGGGFEVRNADDLQRVLERLFNDPSALATAAEAARRYVAANSGATRAVVKTLLAKD